VLVWRLVRRRRLDEAFTGEGARLFGGRWNSRGVRVVYTSSSLALAQLEYLVRLSLFHQPTDVYAVSATLPDDLIVETLTAKQLPRGWRRYDVPLEGLRTIGDRWIRGGASIALQAPSVIVPSEYNVLLNPGHPEFRRLVMVGKAEPVRFDGRLFSTTIKS
jgi:RES domain-containing protein